MYTTTMKKILQALILKGALAGILISNPANAAIIYEQSGSTLPGLNSDGRGIYDDFRLASDFSLTRFEWTGGTVSFSDPPTDAPRSIYGGIGVPDETGNPEGGAILTFNDPNEVFLNSSSTDEMTINVYRYSVDLSTPVILEAGQEYWLGINGSFPSIPPDDDTLQWHWAFGAGGNNRAFRASEPFIELEADFSFTLIGSAMPISVPEPNLILLLGIGLVAFHLSPRLNSRYSERVRVSPAP